MSDDPSRPRCKQRKPYRLFSGWLRCRSCAFTFTVCNPTKLGRIWLAYRATAHRSHLLSRGVPTRQAWNFRGVSRETVKRTCIHVPEAIHITPWAKSSPRYRPPGHRLQSSSHHGWTPTSSRNFCNILLLFHAASRTVSGISKRPRYPLRHSSSIDSS